MVAVMETRIKEIRLWRGLTQFDLAKKAKTTAATISRWENYPSRVSIDTLNNLARILDVQPAELLGGIKPSTEYSGEIVMIRGINDAQSNPFDPSTLESLTRTPAESLAMLRVKGDSMSPTLDDGDQALVDTTDADIYAGGLYCIQLGQTAQVRRLSVNPVNGRINIMCDNSAYDDYTDVEPNAVKIIGKLVWRGHKL